MIRQALLIAALISCLGCTAEQWAFPRIPVLAKSPDGRYEAFVRNHPELDPPNQSLWIGAAGGVATKVMGVPPDALWCDTILWSADSRRVAFVVANAIVHVYDPASRELVFSGFVGRRSWDTPPRYVMTDAALTAEGSGILFRECERDYVLAPAARQNRTGRRLEQRLRECTSEPQRIQFADLLAHSRTPGQR